MMQTMQSDNFCKIFRTTSIKDKFKEGTVFELKIEVHKDEYRIYLDGNELEKRFPHRVDQKKARAGLNKLYSVELNE